MIFVRTPGALTDTYAVGDVLSSARRGINSKWALCNGDVLKNTSVQTINNLLGTEGQTFDIANTGWKISESFVKGKVCIIDIKSVNNYIIAVGKRFSGSTYYACFWYATSLAGPWTRKDLYSGTNECNYLSDVIYSDNMFVFSGSKERTASIAYSSSINGEYTVYNVTGNNAAAFAGIERSGTAWKIGLCMYQPAGEYLGEREYVNVVTISNIFLGSGTKNISSFTFVTSSSVPSYGMVTSFVCTLVNGQHFYTGRLGASQSSSYSNLVHYDGNVTFHGIKTTYPNRAFDVNYKSDIGYFIQSTGFQSGASAIQPWNGYYVLKSDFSGVDREVIIFSSAAGSCRYSGFANIGKTSMNEERSMLFIDNAYLLYFDRTSDKYFTYYTSDNGGNAAGSAVLRQVFENGSYSEDVTSYIVPCRYSLFKQSGYTNIIAMWKSDGMYFYRANRIPQYSFLPAISLDKVYTYMKVKE